MRFVAQVIALAILGLVCGCSQIDAPKVPTHREPNNTSTVLIHIVEAPRGLLLLRPYIYIYHLMDIQG